MCKGGGWMKSIIQVADLQHYGNDQMNRVYSPQGISPTIKTVSGGGREVKILEDNEAVRALTPKEYFRIMGFDDEDVDLLIANGISKTQLYKMAGNSIVVNVLEFLFCQIFDNENEIWVQKGRLQTSERWKNIEGYSDPTASIAVGQVSREESEADKRAYDLVKVLKFIIRSCGFELIERIQLKDTKSGREYK